MEDPYHEKKNVVNHKKYLSLQGDNKILLDRFLPKGRRLSLFNGIVDTILGVSRRNLDLLNMFQFCSALVSLGHKDLPNIWMTNASLINIQGPRSA